MMVDDLYFPVKFGRQKLCVVDDPSDYFPVCVSNCGGEILGTVFDDFTNLEAQKKG